MSSIHTPSSPPPAERRTNCNCGCILGNEIESFNFLSVHLIWRAHQQVLLPIRLNLSTRQCWINVYIFTPDLANTFKVYIVYNDYLWCHGHNKICYGYVSTPEKGQGMGQKCMVEVVQRSGRVHENSPPKRCPTLFSLCVQGAKDKREWIGRKWAACKSMCFRTAGPPRTMGWETNGHPSVAWLVDRFIYALPQPDPPQTRVAISGPRKQIWLH